MIIEAGKNENGFLFCSLCRRSSVSRVGIVDVFEFDMSSGVVVGVRRVKDRCLTGIKPASQTNPSLKTIKCFLENTSTLSPRALTAHIFTHNQFHFHSDP